MTRALVTGAAGFIGSHVVDHLIEEGIEVVAIDNLQGGVRSNINNSAIWGLGDITDHPYIEELFRSYYFDYVYHLGAYAAEGLSHFIRNYNYTTNLLASVNLINQSVLHGVKRFIFTSSIAVYGAAQPPFREDMYAIPEDPYGISKYAVELDLHAAFKQFGLEYTIFRPHNVYGPRQNISDPYRNVVGIFMRQCMKKEPMTIFGNGSQERAFSYIDDVAKKIAQVPSVMGTRNEVFNIGSDKYASVGSLAYLIAGAFDIKRPEIIYLNERNEVKYAWSDHRKIQRAYKDYDPPTHIVEGLYKTAEWVREQGVPAPTPFPGKIEVPINMPPSWKNGSIQILNNR